MTYIRFKGFLKKVKRFLHILFSREPFREKLYEFFLLIEIQFIRVKIKGNKMWLDLKDNVLSRHYFIYRDYESFEVFLIEKVIKKGMTVLDVGACIGYHTLIISRCVGDFGKVVAFEPAPNNYSMLMRNIRANNISNVLTLNAAVMDYQGNTKLFLSRKNFGDHRVYDAKDEEHFDEGAQREHITVPAIRVDDVLKEYGLKANLIKIDVQGAEIAAFRGMKESLSNPEVVVFCEFWPYGLRKFESSPNEMLDFLDSLGLAVYEIFEVEGHIRLVDFDELINRFPDIGCTNLVCFFPNSPSCKVFAPFIL